MSWTPGPWGYGGVEEVYGTEIWTEADERTVAAVKSEDDADARLIAAAPEMAELLEKLVLSEEGYTRMTSGRFRPPYVADARELLERIRGEA